MQKGIERRSQTVASINKLIKQRQQIFVLLCEIGELKPFKRLHNVNSALNEFCEVLVDYIAFGHFEIYNRILKKSERRKASVKLATSLYLHIVSTTEIALDFNDKYENYDASNNDLNSDLSTLGEALATRIEMEDRFIESLLPAHSIINNLDIAKAA